MRIHTHGPFRIASMTSAPGSRTASAPAATIRTTKFWAPLALIGLLLSGCSEPPPPAEEPTGVDLERAWRIAVGEDPLDQTLAQIYAMALNSRESPTVVVQHEGPAEKLAAALAAEPLTAPGADEDEAGSDGAGSEEDQRYEIVLARTMPLAESLDPEGYAELTAPDEDQSIGPAAAPDDLTELIREELESEEYTGAELFEPTSAVLSQALIITSSTAAQAEISDEAEPGIQELGEFCEELRIGVREDLPNPVPLLQEMYECAPAELTYGSEDDLLQQLITAELDGVVVTSSHPWVGDHALVVLSDEARAFPQDQYAPLVSSRIAEEVPEVAQEISQRLTDEALLTLRRLIEGEQGLSPEEAAEYWLVEEQLIAEPEDWG